MLNKLKPKQIEKNMLFLHSRDGILDIFFGCMLIAAGVNSIFTYNGWDEPWYIRFMILILLIPMLASKFFITTPRTGYIKMNFVKGQEEDIANIYDDKFYPDHFYAPLFHIQDWSDTWPNARGKSSNRIWNYHANHEFYCMVNRTIQSLFCGIMYWFWIFSCKTTGSGIHIELFSRSFHFLYSRNHYRFIRYLSIGPISKKPFIAKH